MSLTPGLQLPFGIQPVNPVPVDAWSGPYSAATAQDAISIANAAITAAIRFQSMEVRLIIANVSHKYWYRDGVANSDLVEFSSQSSSSSNAVITELVLNETPSGSIDGINFTFYLESTPKSSDAVMLWLNGQLLTKTSDYSVTEKEIVISGFVPSVGDVLLAMYSKEVIVKRFAINETVSFVNSSGSLSLSIENIPNPVSSLMLFRNGQLLTQDSDFYVTENKISILNSAIELDDVFLSTYSFN
jgi:hypothetical protein